MTAYCQILDLPLHSVSPLKDKIIESILFFLCFMRSTRSAEHRVNVSVSFISSICVFFFLSLSWPGPLLYLLVLTPHSEPVDVHRDGDHNFGVSHRFSWPVVHVAGLDPFPFGPAVLKPDLHLHLAQFECVRDLRAFGQGKVLFTVKLLFELEQLLAGKSCSSPPALPRRAAGRQRLLRAGF